jgi:cytochrome bd-type quinol oxidase subunit 2
MSYVSIAIPFVIAYIVWVWYKLAKPQDDVAKKAE